MSEIEIKNQGPIEYTKISIPEQGGVVRLLGPNGCLAGQTLIDTPRNLRIYPHGLPICALIGQEPLVYCYDGNKITLSRASAIWKTKGNAPVYRLIFNSKGHEHGQFLPPQEIIGTADHQIMMRDGSYRALSDLKQGDALMPLYRKCVDGKYIAINRNDGTYELEHRLVGAALIGRDLLNSEAAHHKQKNTFDNSEGQIRVLTKTEHARLHGKERPPTYTVHPRGMLGKTHSEETKYKQGAHVRGVKQSEELVAKRFAKVYALNRPWFNAEILNDLYTNQNLSTTQIASILGCSDVTIGYWLHKHSIPVRENHNHKVVSVEFWGYQDVFDIEVPHFHNFVANGVVVHNSGKSNALEGVSQLVNRRGKLVSRDGSSGPEISGFGATVRVGRRLSRSGELEVLGLEGLDISTLVDPKIDDPKAADARRIKALLQLTGAAEAKPEKFYPVVQSQEEFDKYVPSEMLATDDIVVMQASIKRCFEKASRDQTALATKAFAEAEAARVSSKDIDITLPDDSELLAAVHESASNEVARLRERKEAYKKAEAEAATAQEGLDKLQKEYRGLTLEEARKAQTKAIVAIGLKEGDIATLETQLSIARADLVKANHAKELADKDLTSAQDFVKAVESLESTISTILPEPVTENSAAQAAEELRLAKDALEQGALVRKAKEDISKASQRKQEALAAQVKAEELREAAQATEMVLSSAVESLGVPLKVKNNRLVVVGTERGEEVFDDLSDGQKWKLVIQIAIKAVGKGIVVLPQNAWQDLDQANKDIIAQEVTGSGLVILTAQADSSVPELTSDIYDPYQLKE